MKVREYKFEGRSTAVRIKRNVAIAAICSRQKSNIRNMPCAMGIKGIRLAARQNAAGIPNKKYVMRKTL